jgi:membrane-associated phospholipid phosphatase
LALVTIEPTKADIAIANAIAARVTPLPEEIARTVTWGADAHLLVAAAVAAWAYAQWRAPAWRPAASHVLLTTLVATVLPHVLKAAVDQTRPDRLTVRGHWRGISFSGKPRDAFPSGHAVHMGALASAACALPPGARHAAWSLAAGLCLTRIVTLAHWTSDVIVGFGLGILIDRGMGKVTGYSAARLPRGAFRDG